MSNNQFAPDGIGDRVWHYGVLPILRLFASEDVEFYGRLRVLINTAALVAICFLFLAPVFNPAKFVNAAGITFDIAGALRLFLFERISAGLEPFKDETKYPHGPPSVAMRTFIMPEAGPYSTESPHMNHFYYQNRGVVFFLTGFLLQLIANFMS